MSALAFYRESSPIGKRELCALQTWYVRTFGNEAGYAPYHKLFNTTDIRFDTIKQQILNDKSSSVQECA